jgi:hypothetical protein
MCVLRVHFRTGVAGEFLSDFHGNARLRSRLLHLLAVLIDAGQIKDFFALEPVIARDHVGQHLFVSVPDVRRRVRVIDRRCDVKRLRDGAETVPKP